MSNRPARITLADLNRAAKAAKAHGFGVEVKPDGTIVLVPADSGQSGGKPKAKLAGDETDVSDDEFARRLAEIKGGKRANSLLQRP